MTTTRSILVFLGLLALLLIGGPVLHVAVIVLAVIGVLLAAQCGLAPFVIALVLAFVFPPIVAIFAAFCLIFD